MNMAVTAEEEAADGEIRTTEAITGWSIWIANGWSRSIISLSLHISLVGVNPRKHASTLSAFSTLHLQLLILSVRYSSTKLKDMFSVVCE
ncbi:hypothetical protein L2E82_40616 [Cichorium intybus]|uniref:Uncharacterized protein n=1 Tax=Cichorium intybus TaxID=13427 RepID=A0ACB9AKY8_CICIN|nr:hypothetical protein L2E82_40616 [Cichorium intybus]